MALGKNQKQMIMVGGLVLLLALVLIKSLKQTKKPKPSAKKPAAGASGYAAQLAGGASGLATGRAFLPDAKVMQLQLARFSKKGPLKDPFYPIIERVSAKRGSLMLKGISWREGGESFALINNEIAGVGDVILGNKIIEIKKKHIVLEKGGQEYLLMLEEEE